MPARVRRSRLPSTSSRISPATAANVASRSSSVFEGTTRSGMPSGSTRCTNYRRQEPGLLPARPHREPVLARVNAVRPGIRARTKSAIGAIRHLFLEADHDGAAVLAQLKSRVDIPAPSYVLESSFNRVHVFWRVVGFTNETIEGLQKHLAAEFH